jgi:hypothetical protein
MRAKRANETGILGVTKKVMKNKDDIVHRGLYEKETVSFQDAEDREVLKILLGKKGKFRSKEQILYIRKLFNTFGVFREMEQFLASDLMNTLFEKIQYEVKKEDEVVFY